MPRIGVFVCHCGVNIGKTVDCPQVAENAKSFPQVVFSVDNKYMCSDPGQNLIKEAIKEHSLDRVVVASCSPRLHEPTFQGCIESMGLNPYFFEMANIREHCSWVHSDKEAGTEKATELVRMAVAKARRSVPLTGKEVPLEKRALVIGGGIAGIQAAIDIGMAGQKVLLLERSPSIGGRMAQFDKTFPTLDCAACILTPKMVDVTRNENIELYTFSEVEAISGYVGNFIVRIRKKARSVDMSRCNGCGVCYQKCPVKVPSEFDEGMGNRGAIYVPFPQAVPNVPVIDRENCIYFQREKCGICRKLCQPEAIDYEQEDEIVEEKFGAIVVATGFANFDHRVYGEYGYGKYPDVITGLQFERLLSPTGPTGGHILRPSDNREPETIVFLQCIGSRDESKGVPYCSRLCCMYTAKHALMLKEHHPDAKAYVFYMDIRAAGKNYEEFVKRTQVEYGVEYIRGRVSRIFPDDDKLIVCGMDTLSATSVEIKADLVVLATALIARPDATKLAQMLGIPYDENQLFSEAHPKLRPVETVTSGIFLTGSCQAPKDIPDTVATASAASAKVCGLFSKDHLLSEPTVAQVDQNKCTGCLTCVSICPFKALEEEEIIVRKPDEKKIVVRIIETICHGCGACIAGCRSGALQLRGYTDEQLHDQIEALYI